MITYQAEESHYESQEVLRCHVINLSVLASKLSRIMLDSTMNEHRMIDDCSTIQFWNLVGVEEIANCQKFI